MPPGSVRSLVVPAQGAQPRVVQGPVALTSVDPAAPDAAGAARRYRLEALAAGGATVECGAARWHLLIRGAAEPPEQTRDDTGTGWGDDAHGIPRTWWEDQRPPHW
jgi:hypothetical protein